MIHELIDEERYDDAVRIAKNLKYRVHDEAALEKIKEFEESHDNELAKRFDAIDNGDKDPLRKNALKYEEFSKYAKSYLSFYDKLSREYDI